MSISEFHITPLDRSLQSQIQQRIDNKTKPLGALGLLEPLALQLALIQQADDKPRISLDKPTMIVFAGDHGIAEEGVSIAPSVVTQQMVANFLNGGAAINCFCKTVNMDLRVVDAGMLQSNDDPRLIKQSLGPGTANFTKAPAMSAESVSKGLTWGAGVVSSVQAEGCNVIAFGEMGIGNTSASAALMAAFLDKPVDECVGRGTGINDAAFARKVALIEQAVALHRPNLTSPEAILAHLGGFEIVQMTGAILAAAQASMVVMVDGFIASVAALAATRINPACRDYMVFCHQSHERGHAAILDHLQAKPLLDLNLRLGEGTGAALAYPLLQAAACFYNEMASFASAGIEAV